MLYLEHLVFIILNIFSSFQTILRVKQQNIPKFEEDSEPKIPSKQMAESKAKTQKKELIH